MPVKMTIRKNWDSEMHAGLQIGLLEMSTDVDRRAKILAPVDTRALVNSGKITPSRASDTYVVKFGSSKVPYARKRHYQNKKNPQTLRYLERAADSITHADMAKYFRGKV